MSSIVSAERLKNFANLTAKAAVTLLSNREYRIAALRLALSQIN